MFTAQDRDYMAKAIQLAKRGMFTSDPNPRVGCVIVENPSFKAHGSKVNGSKASGAEANGIIGEGWHEAAGQGHAEVRAFEKVKNNASSDVAGATVYITLEPCSYHGRTPPCIDALIKAGVGKVIVAMQDPNPLVAGKGIKALRQAGIECIVGLLEKEARQLNPGFERRMTQQRPWVRIKLAMSLDGRTAMSSGESQWITGPEARLDVQRLRARSSAIITGVNTVIDDDAALTVRTDDWLQSYFSDDATLDQVRQPKRVVLDSTLRTPEQARILKQAGQTLIVGNEKTVLSSETFIAKKKSLEQLGAKVLLLSGDKNKVDLKSLLSVLAEDECNEVLVEAGATLAGDFFQQNLWDELIVYVAPKLMGHLARPLLALPLEQMSQVDHFEWHDITQIGSDIRLTLLNK